MPLDPAQAVMVLYLENDAKIETIEARQSRLYTDLIERVNILLNVLWDHRERVAQTGLLGDLSENLQKQSSLLEDILSANSDRAQVRAEHARAINELVKRMRREPTN